MKLLLSLVLGAVALAPARLPSQTATTAPPVPRHAVVRDTATDADVTFMRGMIGHHAQALAMSSLVAGRAAHPQMALLAERITVSQRDEIAIMQRWLIERGLPVPAVDTLPPGAAPAHASHDPHEGHAGHAMPGMLTPAQMDSLVRASGHAFDRLFLQYMIQHHEGALTMVADLLASRNAARDPQLFQFAADVDADQRAEIRRMRTLLASLP